MAVYWGFAVMPLCDSQYHRHPSLIPGAGAKTRRIQQTKIGQFKRSVAALATNNDKSNAPCCSASDADKMREWIEVIRGMFGSMSADEISVSDASLVQRIYERISVDEHLCLVDRVQRLGIARYFESEIRDSLDYVYRYWSEEGIGWANIQALNDTAIAFRLLRLHGYDVSPEVFNHFREHGGSFCFKRHTRQTINAMYNLYRASQTMFPGEKILEEAKTFTMSFLEEKLKSTKELQEKCSISKDLQGEIEYALNFPWYASLQRVETRQYLERFEAREALIERSLHTFMHYENHKTFLNLSKADYNLCQSFHKRELEQIIRWNKECQFEKLNFARQKPIECLFSVAATMFEPEMSLARLVWARCSVLTTVIDDFFDTEGSLEELMTFLKAVESWDPAPIQDCSEDMKILFMGLYNTTNAISQEAFICQGWDISFHLRQIWVRWIISIMKEAEWTHSSHSPSFQEYMDVATISFGLEPIVISSLFFIGTKLSRDIIAHDDYFNVMQFVNIVGRLLNDIQGFKQESAQGKCSSVNIYLRENPHATTEEAIAHFKLMIEENMAQLVQELLRTTTLPKPCKLVHFNMARINNLFHLKSDGYSSLTDMEGNVKKVLFIPVQ